ncbi:hypothetical protein [Nocardia sp. NBC_01329]|uniref:hypothetical protein n=1 Tax=Nocardia sp. NBC_01329 TaxID=2903594 RepID=UPI002E0D9177|nr:hypothetical protein OG405_14555 [Nocardia sp. NBC_01329]
MGKVRVDLNISLDGYATTTDQTPDDPMGKDWNRLVAAYAATRTFRERVLGVRLWDDLRELEEGYKVDSEVASSGTIHVTFSR